MVSSDDEPQSKRRRVDKVKLTKEGLPKQTRGAARRPGAHLRASEKCEAVEMYQAARALGFPPCNDAGLAAGTKLAYSTVYKWSKMQKKPAGACCQREQKQAQPPKEGHVEEEQALHALEKAPDEAPSQAQKQVTQGHHPACACSGPPRIRETNQPSHGERSVMANGRSDRPGFRTNYRRIQLWFSMRSWSSRRATKKRSTSSAADNASMRKYCDKLRWAVQQVPQSGGWLRCLNP